MTAHPGGSSRQRTLKVLGVCFFLYAFLISIKLLGASFKLFGADFAEALIRSCSNPAVGLFIGIFATTLVQSSSMTTSLVVGFVGGGILPVEYAIPMIMGANIGTTITNILVSFTFVTRREDFRRAFAGATVHDFFNLLSVLTFFPLELKYHFLQRMAVWMTGVFEGIGGVTVTSPIKAITGPAVQGVQHFLMDVLRFSEGFGGAIMLIGAVAVLLLSLISLVKLMRGLIVGQTEVFMDRYLFRNDLSAFLLGVGLTVAVQSSSITTSLIIPLVGAGIVSVRRCYPFTLGANIGTTCTALLASLATVTVVEGQAANTIGVTAAFAHLLFNICGIVVFYPLKRMPLWLAHRLADVAAKSKLLAVAFVVGVFFAIPMVAIFLGR